MKRRARIVSVCWAGLLLVGLSVGAARGSVTILDSEYHVEGAFGYLVDAPDDPLGAIYKRVEYDYTSSSPVSGAIGCEGIEAVSGAVPSQVSAYAQAGGPENYGGSFAEAQYIVTFQPWDTDLSITFTYEKMWVDAADYPSARAYVTLKNLTSGTTLIDSGSWGTGLFGQGASEASPYHPDGWPLPPYWERYDLTVDPTHVYQLRLCAEAGASPAYIPIGEVTVTSSIPPVPAPGAILLSTLGAGLVGWLRQRGTL